MTHYGMNLADYDYVLPESFIAQTPVEPRDTCKLMTLNRETGTLSHHIFRDIIDFLNPEDVLVINETRVFPARLLGQKKTGARIEVLLLEQKAPNQWEALVKPGRKFRTGDTAFFGENGLQITVLEDDLPEGIRLVETSAAGEEFFKIVESIGHIPLPPYIRRDDTTQDREDYQTVFARERGSVAAPTAGLHFTPDLLAAIKQKGIVMAPVTLHVGLGTFRPVNVENIREHEMHHEFYSVSQASADIINQRRNNGGRVIAVGTTSVRTLETASQANGELIPGSGWSNIFIYPGYDFKITDGIITNFHLPKSSLMMMISAFSSLPIVLNAYETAKENGYRFFSYGDAMFLS